MSLFKSNGTYSAVRCVNSDQSTIRVRDWSVQTLFRALRIFSHRYLGTSSTSMGCHASNNGPAPADYVIPKPQPPPKMRLPKVPMNDPVTQKMLEVDTPKRSLTPCTVNQQPQCTVTCICVRHVIRTESTARTLKHSSTEFC